MSYETESALLRRRGAPAGPVPRHANGYALVVRCDKGHGGNRRFARAIGIYWECCGCGQFRTAAELAVAQLAELRHAEAGGAS